MKPETEFHFMEPANPRQEAWAMAIEVIRRAQRDDSVEIRHVPAFLQHVDVDMRVGTFARRPRLHHHRRDAAWAVRSDIDKNMASPFVSAGEHDP